MAFKKSIKYIKLKSDRQLMNLFISPPFGNYINLPYTRSIKGSFTLEPRPGLFSQIIKTLRYSFEHKGWINKIGLRNKGIDWAVDKYKNGYFDFYRNSVISIAILEENEIFQHHPAMDNNRFTLKGHQQHHIFIQTNQPLGAIF